MKFALLALAILVSSAALSASRFVLKDKAGNNLSWHSSHESCMKARSNKSRAGIKGTYCVTASR